MIKEGLFWICNGGLHALFWKDYWDGHPPLISSLPQLQPLCHTFTNVGWFKVEHFKTIKRLRQVEVTCWKDSQEWFFGGFDEDRALLAHVLENRFCSFLKGRDVLAWDPSPIGKFLVAQGYAMLDRNLHSTVEVH